MVLPDQPAYQDRIVAQLSPGDRVVVVGIARTAPYKEFRNGVHKYNNQDHSMLAAMMTAANVQGSSSDTWATNTELGYQEEMLLETPR